MHSYAHLNVPIYPVAQTRFSPGPQPGRQGRAPLHLLRGEGQQGVRAGRTQVRTHLRGGSQGVILEGIFLVVTRVLALVLTLLVVGVYCKSFLESEVQQHLYIIL